METNKKSQRMHARDAPAVSPQRGPTKRARPMETESSHRTACAHARRKKERAEPAAQETCYKRAPDAEQTLQHTRRKELGRREQESQSAGDQSTCLRRPVQPPRLRPTYNAHRIICTVHNMIRSGASATEPRVVPAPLQRHWSFFVDEAGRKICACARRRWKASGRRACRGRHYACCAAACHVEVRSEERGPTCPPSAPRGELTCPRAALVKETSRGDLHRPSLLAGTSHGQWSCHRPRHRKRISSTTSKHGAGQP